MERGLSQIGSDDEEMFPQTSYETPAGSPVGSPAGSPATSHAYTTPAARQTMRQLVFSTPRELNRLTPQPIIAGGLGSPVSTELKEAEVVPNLPTFIRKPRIGLTVRKYIDDLNNVINNFTNSPFERSRFYLDVDQIEIETIFPSYPNLCQFVSFTIQFLYDFNTTREAARLYQEIGMRTNRIHSYVELAHVTCNVYVIEQRNLDGGDSPELVFLGAIHSETVSKFQKLGLNTFLRKVSYNLLADNLACDIMVDAAAAAISAYTLCKREFGFKIAHETMNSRLRRNEPILKDFLRQKGMSYTEIDQCIANDLELQKMRRIQQQVDSTINMVQLNPRAIQVPANLCEFKNHFQELVARISPLINRMTSSVQ